MKTYTHSVGQAVNTLAERGYHFSWSYSEDSRCYYVYLKELRANDNPSSEFVAETRNAHDLLKLFNTFLFVTAKES